MGKTIITYVRRFRGCIAVMLVLFPAGNLPAQEKVLRTLEKQVSMAYVMLDFTTLQKLYADEFINVNHDGTLQTKKQIVEMIRMATIRLDSIPVSDSKIRFYGNTAVITGVRTYYRAGKILGVVRYTDVWVNKRNQWQCVSGQLTPVPDRK